MVLGLVLAAGKSERMGQPKLAMYYEGEPMLRAVVRKLYDGGCDQVRIVFGHHAEILLNLLYGTDIEIVYNENPDEGMLSSIKIGIAPTRERMESLTIFAKSMHYKDGKRPTETTTWALKGPDLDKQYDAVMIQPGDIPGFTVQTVETMIAAMEDSQADAWIATCFSKRGHPLLLPTASIASVVNFEGESLRDWLRDPSRKVIEVETDDPGVLKDYDTPEDL